MRNGCARGKLVVAVLGLLGLAGAPGCTYLSNRGSDAKQMMDLGFTFTKKPQFGLYANCPMVTPIGYSKVDGYFVGVGGGKLGAGEHHQDNAGMLFWGREKNSWKGLGKNDKATTDDHRAGVAGLAQSAKEGTLRYRPACVHYLHLGYVGVMWNLNYFKAADFFCGWFGYIPFGDRNEVKDDARVAMAAPKPSAPAPAPAKPAPKPLAPAPAVAVAAPKPPAPAPTVAKADTQAAPTPTVAAPMPTPPVATARVRGSMPAALLLPAAAMAAKPDSRGFTPFEPGLPFDDLHPMRSAALASASPAPAPAKSAATAVSAPKPEAAPAVAPAQPIALEPSEVAPEPRREVVAKAPAKEAPASSSLRFPLAQLVP